MLRSATTSSVICLRRSSPEVRGFFGELLEAGALLCEDLLELLCDLAVGASEVVAVELRLAALAQARHQVAQSLHPFAAALRKPELSIRRKAASGSPW